jgi:hypothetical protein
MAYAKRTDAAESAIKIPVSKTGPAVAIYAFLVIPSAITVSRILMRSTTIFIYYIAHRPR